MMRGPELLVGDPGLLLRLLLQQERPDRPGHIVIDRHDQQHFSMVVDRGVVEVAEQEVERGQAVRAEIACTASPPGSTPTDAPTLPDPVPGSTLERSGRTRST